MTRILPDVGSSLFLTVVPTGISLVSIVDEDLREDGMLVFAPLGADRMPVTDVADGSPLLLRWTSAGGCHELDVTLVEVQAVHVPRWRLFATGPTRTAQHRRYARAADSLPAQLTSGMRMWSATVSDISEGGARALVADPRGLELHDVVVLHVTVDDQPLQVTGRLLEVVAADVGRTQLRLEFEDVGRAGNLLRRRVLTQQIRARAATRDAGGR